ncbi:MAG TPA: serine/threonine-protein kinase [Vicinamibacteria bacterium]|nr:serine/threonine-protein kinase [Vicinamibacteria bacterium]
MLRADAADKGSRRRIGKYAVVGRIGRGGMGMVYRGWDAVLEREVAVKTLTVEGTLDEESRKRFQIEARAAARLQHANIVTVFELGEDRGLPFIAMELLPGVDLETLMRSGEPLLLPEKLDAMVQVLRGLHFAHEHGIVHRDIKPSNIRLLEDGTAKIMDFGIAKLGATGVTKTGMMVGTVHYMSPEQIRGRKLDGRSDVFSAGVILYELLSGGRPFTGDSATAVLYKIIQEPAPPVDPEAAAGAPELPAIVGRALAKDPDERYPTAGRMAEDLAAVAARLRGPAAPPEVLELVSASRRLIKEGKPDDAMRRLQDATLRHPQSIEARRALRTASREVQRRLKPPEPEKDDFPELDATYQDSPTRRTPDTVMTRVAGDAAGTAADPAALAAGPSSSSAARLLVGVAGVALLVAVVAGSLLLTRRRPPPTVTTVVTLRSQPPPAPPTPAMPIAAVEVAIPLVTEPAGASVSVDGVAVPGVTPLTIAVDPAREHRVSVRLDGHATREVRLAAGAAASEMRVTLEPSGPPGRVAISAPYPVEVSWRGRVLSKAQPSPEVSLPAGRHTLTLSAPTYFLRLSVAVDVRPPAVTQLAAPPLGRINIRAIPDNCRIFIDGAFVEYPPILDRAIATGPHKVAFKWPDGSEREESVEVPPTGPAYVTGRKD